MKQLFLLLLLAVVGTAQAQNFEKTFSFSTGNNTREYANAGIELSDGKILIGINNVILCLAANGDSIWSKKYTNFGDIYKLFRNKQGELIAATTLGKMIFLKINETNGDTISSFRPPAQIPNSGYIIYDVVVLPDGDYILSYTLGGSGNGGILTRFTPGSTTRKWSNDYAGKNESPKALYLEDTTLVIAGYKGNPQATWNFDLYLEKISINNVSLWKKAYLNSKSSYKDYLVGVQKNNQNQYLLAANFPYNNRACASVLKVANNGDSLALSQLTTYLGDTINYGYAYSISRNGTNGFYASSRINVPKKDPFNKINGIGYMTILEISEGGQIAKSAAYNNIGHFQLDANSYEGSQSWGTGVFKSKDGPYILYGTGNILAPGTPGWIWQSQFRGYVVKNTAFSTSISPIMQETTSILAYPNPFTQELNLESEHPILQLKVINLQGQEILCMQPNTQQVSIDLSQQNSGIYLVQTETKYGLKHQKVVKN